MFLLIGYSIEVDFLVNISQKCSTTNYTNFMRIIKVHGAFYPLSVDCRAPSPRVGWFTPLLLYTTPPYATTTLCHPYFLPLYFTPLYSMPPLLFATLLYATVTFHHYYSTVYTTADCLITSCSDWGGDSEMLDTLRVTFKVYTV